MLSSPRVEVDVVDLLVTQAEQARFLARDRRHLVATAADELEERRSHLVAACDHSLRKQRWHQRGRQVVRWLVQVVRRGAGRMLTTEPPVADAAQQARRDDCQDAGRQDPCPRVMERVLQLAFVARRAIGGGLLPRDRRGEDLVVHVARVGRPRRERRGRIEHAQRHAAPRRHVVDGGQHLAAPHRQAMIEPGRLDPAARSGQRTCGAHVGRQQPEAVVPLVAPDLRGHLDGVVVRDHDAAQAVAQREGPPAPVLLVVPHDAQALRQTDRAELAGGIAAAESRVAPRGVGSAALAHLDVLRADVLCQRNVPVGAREETVEAEGEVLAHQHLAVARDRHVDGRLRDAEALVRECRGGRHEHCRECEGEPRAPSHRRPSASSKSARRLNPSAPAKRLAGNCSIVALYVCTVSL